MKMQTYHVLWYAIFVVGGIWHQPQSSRCANEWYTVVSHYNDVW